MGALGVWECARNLSASSAGCACKVEQGKARRSELHATGFLKCAGNMPHVAVNLPDSFAILRPREAGVAICYREMRIHQRYFTASKQLARPMPHDVRAVLHVAVSSLE